MREMPDANKSDGQAGGTLAPAHVFRRLSQDCPDPMNQHSSQIELSNTVATTPRFLRSHWFPLFMGDSGDWTLFRLPS